MKRCPQCLFLYPDSDELCDFDKTPLEVVDDAEIDRATNPAKAKRSRRKTLPIAIVAGLVLCVLGVMIYFGVSRFGRKTVAATTDPIPVATAPTPVVAAPSPSPVASPSPSPSPSPKASPLNSIASHSRATTAPVSTSGPGMASSGKPVIMLTSGGRIEADEVWRTRDGVWYRKNGMVTLLKRGQVKAIVSR